MTLVRRVPDPEPEVQVYRSVLAVAAGFVFIAAMSLGTDSVVRQLAAGAYDSAGRVESVPILLFTLLYVGLFAVTGCYLAARLARKHPMRHALILGGIGLAFNIMGSAMMWHTAPGWYHLTGLALVLPYAWVGGRLRERELARFAEPDAAVRRA
jgi:hypothetical protein